MKRSILFASLAFLMSLQLLAQEIELSFTGQDNVAWTQLDSIKIINRSQGGDTTLSWPDTVMILGGTVGIPNGINFDNQFKVIQNYPNPVRTNSVIKFYIPEYEFIDLVITDLLGRQQLRQTNQLEAGFHSFTLVPGNENIYFITVRYKDQRKSLRVTNLSNNTGKCDLTYSGKTNDVDLNKAVKYRSMFNWITGDELLYVGFSGTVQSGMLDTPVEDASYAFQFASNIPCPGIESVDYGGQVYNTVQIMSQCWLKENLNIGEMIMNNEEPDDNSVIEKYCLENKVDSCGLYGGFYQWNELMKYTNENKQGICPDGWHIPDDEEWKILEGAVDTQFGIGNPVWDNDLYRGTDAGTNLKSDYLWHNDGHGTDAFGLKVLPNGYKGTDGFFYNQYRETFFWTSTKSTNENAWYRYFGYSKQNIRRDDNNEKERAYSVRCIKD